MAPQDEAGGAEPGLPAVPRADRRRLIQQAGALLLVRQPLELRPQGMVRSEERLLAVQDRRVGAAGVF